MPKYDVLNTENQKVDQVDLSEAVFDAEIKEHLFWEVVRMQRASSRSGSASTKDRSEVNYSGEKLYRQKGTGRSRAGSRRSPLRVGGGVTFGPHPRDYSYRVPKKVRIQALAGALTSKRLDGKLTILDELILTEIKTKAFANILSQLGLTSALFVILEPNEIIEKSSRNLPGVKILRPEGLNVYDILRYESLVVTKAALEKIEGRFAR